jgi:hypothetical protein
MQKIIIKTNYDFTPAGKRSVRIVKQHNNAIRGYVSGHRYMDFNTVAEALAWRDNTLNLLPQSWHDMI